MPTLIVLTLVAWIATYFVYGDEIFTPVTGVDSVSDSPSSLTALFRFVTLTGIPSMAVWLRVTIFMAIQLPWIIIILELIIMMIRALAGNSVTGALLAVGGVIVGGLGLIALFN